MKCINNINEILKTVKNIMNGRTKKCLFKTVALIDWKLLLNINLYEYRLNKINNMKK